MLGCDFRPCLGFPISTAQIMRAPTSERGCKFDGRQHKDSSHHGAERVVCGQQSKHCHCDHEDHWQEGKRVPGSRAGPLDLGRGSPLSS